MKIKALINCTGVGYENLKKGESKTVTKKVGEKLVSFGYAVEVKGSSKEKAESPESVDKPEEPTDEEGEKEE